jgi:hypothetical protein
MLSFPFLDFFCSVKGVKVPTGSDFNLLRQSVYDISVTGTHF